MGEQKSVAELFRDENFDWRTFGMEALVKDKVVPKVPTVQDDEQKRNFIEVKCRCLARVGSFNANI